MSEHKHTPGPWQVKHDFDTEGRTTILGNVDGEIIDGTTHYSFDFVARTLDEDDDSQCPSIAVANADFIVRACNSHDAMLAALKAAEQLFHHTFAQDGTVHKQIRAAITKALGQ